MFENKTLTCAGCGQDFDFSAEEQEFYSEKGFNEPKRCKPCRDEAKAQRRGGGGGGFQRRPREMHDATCSACGVETQVPFKPDGHKPVFCRDCYQEQKAAY